jgi:hypothetical protein
MSERHGIISSMKGLREGRTTFSKAKCQKAKYYRAIGDLL